MVYHNPDQPHQREEPIDMRFSNVVQGQPWENEHSSRKHSSCHTHFNDVILLFKNCAGQRALVAVVQPVGVCAVLQEKPDEVGVAMICRQHELSHPHPVSLSFSVAPHGQLGLRCSGAKGKGRGGAGM